MNRAHDYHVPITGTLGTLVAKKETALMALEAEERNRIDSGLRVLDGRLPGYEKRIQAIKFVIKHGQAVATGEK